MYITKSLCCPTEINTTLEIKYTSISSVQFSLVAQPCPTVCNPMNRSTPDLSVHHQLPEFTQTHVHRVCDAIQPFHPLSSPFPPAPNPSQHHSLFQCAALNLPANLENSAVGTELEKVSFHSNPKERQCQRMLELLHNCTHLTH